ncbi:uncharacterized protein DUF1206 [Breoghania corrubedonensis]|uniref:Uncharacterized protein DUF1206 n=1 Tax=Breoghania corrubedonensis TaxID=665038 RepID=A0A2T5VF16_9HYPH|nr:DUF1206 domain-containing protein [Breoghania corrubedonensis]PTW62345.1 uncharacterized protein DUF1206 [Breoghania corrubedonensis]
MRTPDPLMLRHLARLGYAARGLVYAVIGSFALLAATGYGQSKDTNGALEAILSAPFGALAAMALIAGFICYAGWRAIQAVFDPDGHGLTPAGIAIRLGLLASGAGYATLTVYTWSVLDGVVEQEERKGSAAQWLAGVIGSQWAASLVAAVFIGVGIAHAWKAISMRYDDHFMAGGKVMSIVHPVAITGLLARCVTFFIIAALLFYRGLNAGKDGGSPGLKEALEFIRELPAGGWLLGGMGAGLLAFALYSFTEAAFRRINVRDAFQVEAPQSFR